MGKHDRKGCLRVTVDGSYHKCGVDGEYCTVFYQAEASLAVDSL
jgi:hypothetical protein